MPTAAATGRKRVARNVCDDATWEVEPVRHDRVHLAEPERAGAGDDQYGGERRQRDQADDAPEQDEDQRASTGPEKIDAQRVRAPAATLRAV